MTTSPSSQLDIFDAAPASVMALVEARLDRIDASLDVRQRYTGHIHRKYAGHLDDLRFGGRVRQSVFRRLEQLEHWRGLFGPEGVEVGIALIECAIEEAGCESE